MVADQLRTGIPPMTAVERLASDPKMARQLWEVAQLDGWVEAMWALAGQATADTIAATVDAMRRGVAPTGRLTVAHRPPWEQKQDDRTRVAFRFDLADPEVAEGIRQDSEMLEGFTDTAWRRIRTAVAAGVEKGEGINGLIRRVTGAASTVGARQAETVARTMVTRAANRAAIAAARQTGVVEQKRWMATLDHRTRPAHREADGQTVALDAPFDVGGELIPSPGTGSPPNSVRCRCAVTFVLARRV